MLTNLKDKTNQYISIYDELKSKLRWKVAHNQILMLISSAYIVNKRDFDFQRFYDLSSYIKSNIGSFSTLNSHHRFTVASILDIHFQHEAKQTFLTFIDVYNQMVRLGYKRDIFTYISALILLTGKTETINQREQMNMGLSVYQQMKKNHYFLTSTQNVPLAVLLAQNGKGLQALNKAELCYQLLSANGFKKGQYLQHVSHILALQSEKDPEILVSQCKHIFQSITESHKKPKDFHYPDLSLLTFLEEPDIKTVLGIAHELNQEKAFKWEKDMNFKIAVSLYLSEYMEKNLLMESGLYTAIETAIQAQQAAATAVIISSSAIHSHDGN
ncbi:DUF4003 domain-containing protein [Bacillus mojavensis]|uniref:DUF4003 domain-containing protein n=1 Tax=Bacillus mojavensis TaxID=72360 RepID=UPI002DBC4F39|nr:DUF4003 domain-containing protein [Bacillus mojavensis]MEC1290988.1 DUF4003 domain-containing protein [Bacillus mojavensis]MEC1704445.1 DUF4003 domain-containing protein [Bacillus mojavensis]MEC5245588.1 DUF4003 domain-containing protein [Bacillus mojavensis]